MAEDPRFTIFCTEPFERVGPEEKIRNPVLEVRRHVKKNTAFCVTAHFYRCNGTLCTIFTCPVRQDFLYSL